MECSRETVFRLIGLLRDFLGAPIVRDADGYRYAREQGARAYELPGLWFSDRELQALLVFQRLLDNLEPGLLSQHFAALSRRLGELVKHKRLGLGETATAHPPARLGAATGGRPFSDGRQRHIAAPPSAHHLARAEQGANRLANALSTAAHSLRRRLVSRAEAELDELFASAYGIFAGKADKTAILRFSAERARSVTDEWHPQQAG